MDLTNNRLHRVLAEFDLITGVPGRGDLMTTPYQNYNNDQCTDFDDAVGDATRRSRRQAPARRRRRKIPFFVSDGVGDACHPSSCNKPDWRALQEPLNCDLHRLKGAASTSRCSDLQLPPAWYAELDRPVLAGLRAIATFEIAKNMQAAQRRVTTSRLAQLKHLRRHDRTIQEGGLAGTSDAVSKTATCHC